MIDKKKAYLDLGYKFKLICDHKEMSVQYNGYYFGFVTRRFQFNSEYRLNLYKIIISGGYSVMASTNPLQGFRGVRIPYPPQNNFEKQ